MNIISLYYLPPLSKNFLYFSIPLRKKRIALLLLIHPEVYVTACAVLE